MHYTNTRMHGGTSAALLRMLALVRLRRLARFTRSSHRITQTLIPMMHCAEGNGEANDGRILTATMPHLFQSARAGSLSVAALHFRRPLTNSGRLTKLIEMLLLGFVSYQQLEPHL